MYSEHLIVFSVFFRLKKGVATDFSLQTTYRDGAVGRGRGEVNPSPGTGRALDRVFSVF